MKNESRIVELLTDMVKKQDRQEELFVKMVERQDRQEDLLIKMVERQDRQEVLLNNHSDLLGRIAKILEHQTSRFSEVDDLRDRLRRVEKHVGLG